MVKITMDLPDWPITLKMPAILKVVGCRTSILEIENTREDGDDIAGILLKKV